MGTVPLTQTTGRRKEAVARAHGARFAAVMPANTLVEATLVGEEYLVEIEADAEIPRPA